MKFSWKILFCTMLIMAAACGARGYFFVNYVFQTSMERETRQALDESSILRFAFETAALNIPWRRQREIWQSQKEHGMEISL